LRRPAPVLRRLRLLAALLVGLGLLGIAWTLVTWRWGDPLTSLWGGYRQHQLAGTYATRLRTYRPDPTGRGASLAQERRRVALEASRYRRSLKLGAPLGRIDVPRLGLNTVVVQGTNEPQLDEGPGHYPGSFLPGQRQLVYIAGHRTTYTAPFANIQLLRRGDRITLSLPYATFVYRVRWHVIVRATDVRRLFSHGRELLALQSCHPRFSASHRYIVYAVPVRVIPRGMRPYSLSRGRSRG
jgi:sortase A